MREERDGGGDRGSAGDSAVAVGDCDNKVNGASLCRLCMCSRVGGNMMGKLHHPQIMIMSFWTLLRMRTQQSNRRESEIREGRTEEWGEG